MLKKIATLSLLLPTLFFTKAEANTYSEPCCQSQWNLYGDWLYWRARRSSLDYAVPIIINNGFLLAQGEVIAIEPSYKSGFRVGLLYECDSFL